jgi:hypothetical protein
MNTEWFNALKMDPVRIGFYETHEGTVGQTRMRKWTGSMWKPKFGGHDLQRGSVFWRGLSAPPTFPKRKPTRTLGEINQRWFALRAKARRKVNNNWIYVGDGGT